MTNPASNACEARGDSLTRRAFLAYGTSAVGALVVAGTLGQVASVSAAPARDALSPRRQESLAAIVEALADGAHGIDANASKQVVAAVSSRYRRETPQMRRSIDDALDVVDRGLEPGEFNQMRVRDRLARLHGGVTGGINLSPEELAAGVTPEPILFGSAVNLVVTSLPTAPANWSPRRWNGR